MFNTNELPKEIEHNHAFYRRFLILNFNQTIVNGDPELAKKITATELPGIFNWVLGGLHRLLEQKKFTHSQAMNDALEEYKKDSDSVLTFLYDESYEPKADSAIKLSQFYQTYASYCKNNGFRSTSVKSFSKRLKMQKYTIWKKNTGMYVDAGKIGLIDPSQRSHDSQDFEGEASE